jgi:integrase
MELEMGTQLDYETYDDKPLMTVCNGDIYRVTYNASFKKNRAGEKVGAYLLWKNKKKLKTKMELKDIALEFYSATIESRNLIDIPANLPTKTTTEQTTIIPEGDTIIRVGSELVGVSDEQHFLIDGEARNVPYKDGKFEYSKEVTRRGLTPEFIIAEFMKLLAKDKHQVSALSGIPAFAHLEDYMLPIVKSSYTPEQLIQAFRDRIPEPTPENMRNAEAYFGEFITLCGISLGQKIITIGDITGEAVAYYAGQIHKVATNVKYLPSWLSKAQKEKLKQSTTLPRHYWHKHRKAMVKAVLSNAVDRLIHNPNSPEKQQFDDLEFWLSKIKTLPRVKKPPVIMSIEDYNKLLKCADLKWECMLRMMLNCAFTLVDIVNLQKKDIKTETGELIKNREKEVSPLRYAKLHPKTFEVLKQYMQEHPSKSDFIFAGEGGKQLTVPTTRVSFNRLKKRAGVSKEVLAKYIRKSSATTATNCAGITAMHINLLLGQSVEILDHYVNQAMQIVGDACIYICEQYFTENSEQKI